MKNNYLSLGKKGEELVARYLEDDGYVIQALNYAQRCGEIDIIAKKNDVLAFVEVKLRQFHYFNISEIITPQKQQKIIKTARYYIAEHDYHAQDIIFRFDVALLEPKGFDFTINYIPNAFIDYRDF